MSLAFADTSKDMDKLVCERARRGYRTRRRAAWRALFPVKALFASALAASASALAASASAQSPSLTFVQAWEVHLPDTGSPVALSSPNIATLQGSPAVVVGDRSGHVYALSLVDGHELPGWPVSTPGPVDSTPSVAVLGPVPGQATVFVGVGNAFLPRQGGYEAFDDNGVRRWLVRVDNPPTDMDPAGGVEASLAVGELQGKLAEVVAPSLGQKEYALYASTGRLLAGFPWFTSDSGFSTPALADLYGNGQTDIIEGADQSPGEAYGTTYTKGGHLRVLAPVGNLGSPSPSGGLLCEYNTDQVVQSSPAVGHFLGGGSLGIVVGTGQYWPHAQDTGKLLALGTDCHLVWEVALSGYTSSSPALADILGNGQLQVVEGTSNGHGGGSVYALSGRTGHVLWHEPVDGEVIGSVVTADFGQGYQDVIVPTTHGAVVLDGRNGHLLAALAPYLGLQNSPLVTGDPNGRIGVTLAGYDAYDTGTVVHFQLAGSSGQRVAEAGGWPMFHHDPQLTGNAGKPLQQLVYGKSAG